MTEKEMQRLLKRHRDIAEHGAGVLEIMAEKQARQNGLARFCARHDIGCSRCGTRLNPWAAVSDRFGRPWAICVMCVRKRRAA